MSQKLAIAMSGAVSFGSYQAGVIYEMVEAIAQHNDHPDTAANQRIEIDVVTGASAGAITACILVQKLMFEAEALRQPYANALHGPWVEDMALAALLNLRSTEAPSRSLLSSDQFAEISYRYLLQRYASGHPTPRQRHPASAASIRLGLALANLNGVDCTAELTDFPPLSQPASRYRRLVYSRYTDSLTCEIQNGETDDTAQVWQRLERAARSSSSLPFVFRLLAIDRQGRSYADAGRALGPPLEPLLEPQSFAYTDAYTDAYTNAYTEAGLFENEPLGLAKHLVNQIDPDHQDHHNRFYLFVSPGAKRSATNRDIRAANATCLQTAAALADAVSAQARLQNWLDISQTNRTIRQFEQQAKELSDMLLKTPQLEAAFGSAADSLLTVLYREGTAVEQRHQQRCDRDRLRQQFTEEYDRLVYGLSQASSLQATADSDLGRGEVACGEAASGEAVAESWLKLVQALEKTQDLGCKDVMTVYAIGGDDPLAGEQIFGLGGLLDQSLRESDYSLGRHQAKQFLKKLQDLHRQGKSEGQLYLLNFETEQALPGLRPNLGQVDLALLSPQSRLALKSQIMARGERIVESMEKRLWVRWLLKLSLRLFLGKQLDELLKLAERQ